MKCPVCKTEYAEATFCPECGFESAVHLFINQNEADNWLQEVVKPYRRKYWESMKHKFIVKNDVLTSYLEASRTIEFPYGIEAVGDCVFFDCEDNALIEEVSIPASVKRIESAAFSGQKNLKRIHLKDGLENIASIAFEGCGLSSLYLPDTVTTIDAGFCFCKASISINPTNPNYFIEDDCLIDRRSCELLHCWSTKQTIRIPNRVKHIGYRAFPFDIGEGRSVVLPDGIESIAEEIGYGIESINVPASVINIEPGAFQGVRRISIEDNPFYEIIDGCLVSKKNNFLVSVSDKDIGSFTIPNKINGIASSAFANCKKLKYLVIPSSIRSIDAYAFAFCNLKSVFCEHKSAPTGWHQSAFALSNWAAMGDASVHWQGAWYFQNGVPVGIED